MSIARSCLMLAGCGLAVAAGACSRPPEATSGASGPAALQGSPLRSERPAAGATQADRGAQPSPAARGPNAPLLTPSGLKPTTVPEMMAAMESQGIDESWTQDVPIDDVDDRGGRYLRLTFARLASFPYDIDEVEEGLAKDPDNLIDMIPPEVRELNGREVVVRGFMMPIDLREGESRRFMLVRNRLGCCFGMLLELNEWMLVQMEPGTSVKWLNDVPISVYGRLEVGEDIHEGMVISIYRMSGHDAEHHGGY